MKILIILISIFLYGCASSDVARETYNTPREKYCLSKNGKPVYDANNYYDSCISQ